MSTVTTTRNNASLPNGLDFYITNRSAYNGYKPLLKNNIAPLFYLNKNNRLATTATVGTFANQPVVSLEDLLDYQQPIVLAFYSANNSAVLQQLESLQADIQVMGGKLIVITETDFRTFRKTGYSVNNLTIYHDENSVIAEKFGLYSFENPLWQFASGIENDALALPAFYVVAPDSEVIYHFVDDQFATLHEGILQHHFVRDLLTSVYHSRQQYSQQKPHYKSVS